jgi:hypothetical protein
MFAKTGANPGFTVSKARQWFRTLARSLGRLSPNGLIHSPPILYQFPPSSPPISTKFFTVLHQYFSRILHTVLFHIQCVLRCFLRFACIACTCICVSSGVFQNGCVGLCICVSSGVFQNGCVGLCIRVYLGNMCV